MQPHFCHVFVQQPHFHSQASLSCFSLTFTSKPHFHLVCFPRASFSCVYFPSCFTGGFSTPSHHGSLTRRHKNRTPITGIASPVKAVMSTNDVSSPETCRALPMRHVPSPSPVHSSMGSLGRIPHSPLRSFSVPDPPGQRKHSTPKHIGKTITPPPTSITLILYLTIILLLVLGYK